MQSASPRSVAPRTPAPRSTRSIERNEFVIAQESIADLLGVHRPTISKALQRLQDEGAIVRRGRAIVVADRSRLEALACECHRILEGEFDRLLSARGNGLEALATTAASPPPAVASESAPALEAMRQIAGRLRLVSIREQEARELAEEASPRKDQFLAMISHELRNPLNAILGWCAILQAQEGVPTAHGVEVIAQNARAQSEAGRRAARCSARAKSAPIAVRPNSGRNCERRPAHSRSKAVASCAGFGVASPVAAISAVLTSRRSLGGAQGHRGHDSLTPRSSSGSNRNGGVAGPRLTTV